MLSGNDLKMTPAYPGYPDGICDGPEEVRKKVREILRAGAEVIKVCSTGGVGSPTDHPNFCLLYTSPSPRDRTRSRMPSSA